MRHLLFALAVAVAISLNGVGAAAEQGKKGGGQKAKKIHAASELKKESQRSDNQKLKSKSAPGKGKVKGTALKHNKKADKHAGTTGGLTPVQTRLEQDPQLASRLRGRLPAGVDLLDAAHGFRNLGQFVAAVNVSRNLGIPFGSLRHRMVNDGMSLGQAIKAERPDSDANRIARRAELEAEEWIRRR